MVRTMATDPHDREQLKHALSEREKELDVLYRLAALFSRRVDDVPATVRETAEILRSSMEHPDTVSVRIETDEHLEMAGAGPDRTGEEGYSARETYGDGNHITITVMFARSAGARESRTCIDEREKHLIASTAALMADLLQRKEMDQELRESTRTLERQAAALERKNIALREVLSQIEHEKRAVLRDARTHVDMYVRPYLHEIGEQSPEDPFVRSRVDQIEASLATLFTEHDHRMVEVAHRLSPREVEICGLIRSGLKTKEISSFLNIGETTVERHRNTIRRKLNLTGSKINLTSYLRSVT
ncbi:MAG: helix-turn-helix transcriptional regulator [Spirochaetota bacterium]